MDAPSNDGYRSSVGRQLDRATQKIRSETQKVIQACKDPKLILQFAVFCVDNGQP
jgi:hypothetical protein